LFESKYYLSRWSQPTLAGACYALGAWVSLHCYNYNCCNLTFFGCRVLLCSLFRYASSSGGDKGSGSDWYSDAGALVKKSMAYHKPVIVVSFKYVFLFNRPCLVVNLCCLVSDLGCWASRPIPKSAMTTSSLAKRALGTMVCYMSFTLSHAT
jgi:hypothetical protein